MKVLYYSFLIIIVDQVTKLAVKGLSIPWLGIDINGIPYRHSVNIIGEYFQLTFIENPGMAFGLQIVSKLFLTLFTLTAAGSLIYFLYRFKNTNLYTRLSLAFILAGAVGNLFDRIFYGVIYGYAPLFYGKVVDFFHINTPGFSIFGRYYDSFPIFNIADISVSIGFVMVVLGYNKIVNSITESKTEQPIEVHESGDKKEDLNVV